MIYLIGYLVSAVIVIFLLSLLAPRRADKEMGIVLLCGIVWPLTFVIAIHCAGVALGKKLRMKD